MNARKRYGVRKVEHIEGGVIAWLHPGGADLDDVLLAIAAYQAAEDDVEWWTTRPVRREGPDPVMPTTAEYAADPAGWAAYWAHQAGYAYLLDEEHPTTLGIAGEPFVGYYRRLPWCHCGDGHDWHYEESAPGPGASLAVVVSSW